MSAFLYRMPSGIAGNVNRDSKNIIEPHRLNQTVLFSAFGLPGKIDGSGFFTPIVAGDAASAVYGLLVRPYPTQSSTPNPSFGAGAPGAAPYGGNMADVLRFGYMSVVNTQGTPALNAPVYVRVGDTDGTGIAIGSLSASQDSTTPADTPQLPGAIFMDAGDADGNVEIAFRI